MTTSASAVAGGGWPGLGIDPFGLGIHPTPQFINICPVCLRVSNGTCYHSERQTAEKLRSIYDAMLDAWLGPKEETS